MARWVPKFTIGALVAVLLKFVGGAVAAVAGEGGETVTVTFQSAAKFDPPQLSAELLRPDGEGPFPAVVMLHGCYGVHELHHNWAARFREMGYVALVVDSFGPRGVKEVCSLPFRVSVRKRVHDAYGALAFLRNQHFVDADRIAIAGWSHGGWSLLHAVRTTGHMPQILVRRFGRFRTAVAFYPYCDVTDVFDIPLLILIGAKDDWTPAGNCAGTARAAEQMQSPERVELVLYPEATHSFDDEWSADPARVAAWAKVDADAVAVPGGYRYLGHLITYDAEAHADSIARVEAFLAKHLARTADEGDSAGD